MSRKYTSLLLDMAEDGAISWKALAKAALGYMSEAAVQDLAESDFGVDEDASDDGEDA